MLTRRELAVKWAAYALCTLLLMFLRALLLGNTQFWGVLPFLPPVILACVAVWALVRMDLTLWKEGGRDGR